MDALPYYKWHWQDYRANRRVQRMPWQARGIYRELLDEFWAEGFLPTSHSDLADIAGTTLEEFAQWWPNIAPCWQERDGRLYNAKMDQQRTAMDAARVAMSVGGRVGGSVSNSSTRDKATQGYPKPTLRVPEGMPDIEEKRTEDYTRQEQKPSLAKKRRERVIRNKPPCKTDIAKARHKQFKAAIGLYWQSKNPGVEMPWGAPEGMQLEIWLRESPNTTIEQFTEYLRNRFKSEANHTERPSIWIRHITSYASEPLNKFKQPQSLNGGTNGTHKPNTYETRNDRILREALESCRDEEAEAAG